MHRLADVEVLVSYPLFGSVFMHFNAAVDVPLREFAAA